LIKADGLQLDPKRCVLILQDLQNDVIMEGGAFADSEARRRMRVRSASSKTCAGSPRRRAPAAFR